VSGWRRRRGLVTAVLAAGAVGGAGVRWWIGAHPAPVIHRVTIDAARFEPARLVVQAGDTVVWVNEDLVPHTATAAAKATAQPRAFDSDVLVQGASWRFTPTAAGTLDYACTFHPTMTGRLEVQ
jgi:plastocyanin